MNIKDVKFDDKGLVPVIAQDAETNLVLMLAYMNEEALNATLETKYMTYYSRSRGKLWRKGETSGHVQKLCELKPDCDGDTLLARVYQTGPACHTGNYSCFYNSLCGESDNAGGYGIIDELFAVIKDRRVNKKEGSYTCYLFEKGVDKICKKIGEEAAEIIIAAKNKNSDEIKYESADFIYHLLVLLCECGIDPAEVFAELRKRR